MIRHLSANSPRAANPPATHRNGSTGKQRRRLVKKKITERKARAFRPYPAAPFEDALVLAQEIQKIAPDGKVRRLTLLKSINKSPTSSSTQMLITNSGKYKITRGSYRAEWLEITPEGLLAVRAETPPRDRLTARFNLAIAGITPFKTLYDEYSRKKLPAHQVIKDFLETAVNGVDNLDECIDLFIVNAKFLGLLQTIAGSETVLPIEQVVEELQPSTQLLTSGTTAPIIPSRDGQPSGRPQEDWSNVCFYISPIGDEGSEERQHSDLFLNHLVEPALREFGSKVIRADKIGESGMITGQILEHLFRARLTIVDLSFGNPNVFYELCLRHAAKLPIVQIIRKQDKIPFDVDQVRTISIDTSGIYSLVPQLETYRSEIATHVRQALANPEAVSNPLTVFCPAFKVSLPEPA